MPRLVPKNLFEDRDEIIGTNGQDNLVGTELSEFIRGLGGNDTIDANGGNDTVHAGIGNDMIFDGTGDDLVFAGIGNDEVSLDGGNNTIYGEAGDDFIYSLLIHDADTIHGGDGDDTILGGHGADLLIGGNGNDQIDSFGNGSVIYGGNGDDVIWVNGHENVTDGEAGNDIIIIANRTAEVTGGEGADDFVIDSMSSILRPTVTIADFNAVEEDRLIFEAGLLKGTNSGIFIGKLENAHHSQANGNDVLILSDDFASAEMAEIAVSAHITDALGVLQAEGIIAFWNTTTKQAEVYFDKNLDQGSNGLDLVGVIANLTNEGFDALTGANFGVYNI